MHSSAYFTALNSVSNSYVSPEELRQFSFMASRMTVYKFRILFITLRLAYGVEVSSNNRNKSTTPRPAFEAALARDHPIHLRQMTLLTRRSGRLWQACARRNRSVSCGLHM